MTLAFNPVTLIPAGTPASPSINGNWQDTGKIINASIHVIFGGADVAGTLTLQASNLNDESAPVTVAGSSQAISASGPHIWNITGIGYRFIRPVWTYTSGTGTITAQMYFKEVDKN